MNITFKNSPLVNKNTSANKNVHMEALLSVKEKNWQQPQRPQTKNLLSKLWYNDILRIH